MGFFLVFHNFKDKTLAYICILNFPSQKPRQLPQPWKNARLSR
jgi:hypothetical protein